MIAGDKLAMELNEYHGHHVCLTTSSRTCSGLIAHAEKFVHPAVGSRESDEWSHHFYSPSKTYIYFINMKSPTANRISSSQHLYRLQQRLSALIHIPSNCISTYRRQHPAHWMELIQLTSGRDSLPSHLLHSQAAQGGKLAAYSSCDICTYFSCACREARG